ncbi:MAG: ATP-binding protein [Opitutaceae bacterium]|jgi:predicted AAA+ superfamily ATPase|nr:ATP-binding protein [Opitutaceae bacterium]
MTPAYLHREIAGRLRSAAAHLPVVVLSGLRQSGKSTLLQNEGELTEGFDYRTLDDFATLAAARSAPEGLLGGKVVLDEAQRCPELLLALKKSVDEDRRNGRCFLSGSANLALLAGVSETLAGRAGYYALRPMTRREQSGKISSAPFLLSFMETPVLPQKIPRVAPLADSEVFAGGLPPACLNGREAADEWFRAYVQSYVERDVRQLSQITDLVAFQSLVRLVALRTAQVLAISSLARDAKLNAVTTGRWLDLMEASFLLWRLPPFLNNRTSRLIKSPKIYLEDSGLAAWLCGVRSFEDATDSLLKGALYETCLAQNLRALLEARAPDARLFFWNEQGRHEVDFVIESGRSVFAMECKSATRWDDADLSGLRAFLDRTPSCKAAILAYNGTTAVRLSERLFVIPLGLLLS